VLGVSDQLGSRLEGLRLCPAPSVAQSVPTEPRPEPRRYDPVPWASPCRRSAAPKVPQPNFTGLNTTEEDIELGLAGKAQPLPPRPKPPEPPAPVPPPPKHLGWS
jgi:hypothetical protein